MWLGNRFRSKFTLRFAQFVRNKSMLSNTHVRSNCLPDAQNDSPPFEELAQICWLRNFTRCSVLNVVSIHFWDCFVFAMAMQIMEFQNGFRLTSIFKSMKLQTIFTGRPDSILLLPGHKFWQLFASSKVTNNHHFQFCGLVLHRNWFYQVRTFIKSWSYGIFILLLDILLSSRDARKIN